ncbi:MAG: hypothetical protein DMF90_22080 [Acidobacteria bacterium]|nr:MAG: hypothetical protein DMF90_22080 [Acidobacteriota bacterium]
MCDEDGRRAEHAVRPRLTAAHFINFLDDQLVRPLSCDAHETQVGEDVARQRQDAAATPEETFPGK